MTTISDVGTVAVFVAHQDRANDFYVDRRPGVPPMFSFRDADGNTLYVVEAVS